MSDTTTANYGDLCDYETGDVIRPATRREAIESLSAELSNTSIVVDGRRCVVCSILDNELLAQFPDSVSAVFNDFIFG